MFCLSVIIAFWETRKLGGEGREWVGEWSGKEGLTISNHINMNAMKHIFYILLPANSLIKMHAIMCQQSPTT